eukprot:1138198-Pelagomonas_calceolata.AAC.2
MSGMAGSTCGSVASLKRQTSSCLGWQGASVALYPVPHHGLVNLVGASFPQCPPSNFGNIVHLAARLWWKAAPENLVPYWSAELPNIHIIDTWQQTMRLAHRSWA